MNRIDYFCGMDPKLKVDIINCGELQVAASCVSSSDEETTAYVPGAILSFARKGQIHVRADNQLYTVPRGSFVLLRKYTEAAYFKTFNEEEGEAQGYNFFLDDNYIRKVIKNLKLKQNPNPIKDRVIIIESTPLLMGLIESIAGYIEEGEDLDPAVLEMKTYEALVALTKANPDIASVLQEYSRAERADLSKFMNYHYLENTTLDDLAMQSGRSLSTFNRDFRMIFNETPHKWILRKRLEQAWNMIKQQGVKPVDVYLQVGFEDLAHFSRAFKKQYNIAPSRI